MQVVRDETQQEMHMKGQKDYIAILTPIPDNMTFTSSNVKRLAPTDAVKLSRNCRPSVDVFSIQST